MHLPVLYQEVIDLLQPHPKGRYVDGTLGAGGHAAGILKAGAPGCELLGLDLDAEALALARQALAPFGDRAHLVQASYTTLPIQLAALGWQSVDGILLDLGVSSMQLDQPRRGFSFREDMPLDMRFNPDDASQPTAAELLNQLSEKELADIFYLYGEDRQARQIARRVVRARPVLTTQQLARLVAQGQAGDRRIHPATRIFQALRIAVNQELDAITTVLPLAAAALHPGGRLAVISFHSLEDRLVKTFFRQESQDCLCPASQPACTCGHKASLRELTRKPLQASDTETQANPRARSARLRVAEKI